MVVYLSDQDEVSITIILSSPPPPQVVGEYSYVHTDVPTEEILESITALLNRRFEESDTHGWVVTAITKLVSQLGHLPESVQSQLALYLTSTDTDIQQVSLSLYIYSSPLLTHYF